MCGRFIIKGSWAEYYNALMIIGEADRGLNTAPRYNVAPTQDVKFIARQEDGNRTLEGQWWLVPWWAKEKTKFAAFNARSETAYKSGAFRDAFKSKRCLIPADGYYEWTKNAEDGKKDPWCITLPDWQPFAFAGLWAQNDHLGITSCTILTAPAAPEIEHLHHRMPIILNPARFQEWLNPETSVSDAREILPDNRGGELVSYRVGREVNNSRSSGAELIEPV
ncbi:MAG: SOS response-associated peptidase [Alphaproteobacteria bacterium]|nr:SOS response-associated peptidase [Alphaproteobacteria bacterium]